MGRRLPPEDHPWFDMEGNPTRIPVPAVTADARTVTDLETTALEKLDRLLAQDRFELPHVEVGRAAVRELARRANEYAGDKVSLHDWGTDWKSRAVAAEADRDGLATALKYADQKIAAVEADRDRLQEAKDNWHRSYVLCRQERDRYRDALEQIVACDFRGNMPREQSIARAALATPDTLPPHVERAIREVEKTATKEVREQTGRDDLVVEFDRRAATPDTPPTSRYSGTPDSPTVRNGVCLLCGSAILSSGIHLRADLPPCYGAPDTPPDARC
jgi:hypothetical protein